MSYRMVHLRIRSKGYNSKWENDTDKSAFKEESRRIFQELGWALKPGGNGICDIVTKGNQDLYLHPSDFSGVMDEANISPDGDSASYGQNAFFYDSAEGLLTAVILLLAEFLPPIEIDGQLQERRHIVSVFKLVQDLLEPSQVKGKSCFQVLMSRLSSDHKARWFAGAALNTSEQAMASVLSTVLSRLNAFLDTELEQTICFDSPLDAESFASKKSAIFLVLPEEDQTKNFMAGLMIQNVRFVP